MDDPANQHAAMLGHVSVAWNDVHWMLYRIFDVLSSMPTHQSQAVFFAIKADSTQRDVVQALAKVSLRSHSELLTQFTELMKQIGRIAGDRNAALHTMWATHYPSRRVTPSPWVPRHGALADDYQTQFTKITEDLRNIFRELIPLHARLLKLFPSPEKDR
jgi:hypothetical protein